MALIDRETISIPLYVFIISRPSRRFNIGTDTWDECRYFSDEGVEGGGGHRESLAGDERSRTEPTGESYVYGIERGVTEER